VVEGASSSSDERTPHSRGRYDLGPELAKGGMARLFLARATGVHGFQKYVVVKRILPRWASDREFVEMFLDEARLAAQLDHPNVVHVHDIGEDDDGPFFAMDYIHGEHLLAIVRAHRARRALVDLAAAVAIGSAAAAGLHHAHERRGFDGRALGLIHRDVSPTNIMATYEGGVKVVDFGIAKATTSRHATRPSVRKGKMAYMSPEQCRGDRLDRRSDVFALGTVLYELVTLSRAFTGEGDFAIMNRIVNHDLEPASSRRPDVPAELDAILARAVARDPAARYGSARELQQDLDAFAGKAGLSATPVAIATMMEDLFGQRPYPWESVGFLSAPTEADDPTHASRPTTVVRPREGATPREPEAGTRRTGRRVAIAAIAVLGAGAASWVATRDGSHSSAAMQDDERAQQVGPPTSAAPDPGAASASPVGRTAAPIERAPALAADASPEPALEPAPTIELGPAPEPVAPEAEPVVARPRTKVRRGRTRPVDPRPQPDPTLPAPFDPDAPAPRPGDR
jgi:serine/threonine protein kinase